MKTNDDELPRAAAGLDHQALLCLAEAALV